MIGFGENVGSGFPKIIAAWKETNWGEPQLLNKLDVDEVELVLPVPSPKSNSTGMSEGVSNRVPNGVSDTAKLYILIFKQILISAETSWLTLQEFRSKTFRSI